MSIKKIGYILLVIMVSMQFVVSAQSGVNPFEVRHHKKSNSPTPDKSSTTKEIDSVIHNESPAKSPSHILQSNNSEATIDHTIEKEKKEEVAKNNPSNSNHKIDPQNPFAVRYDKVLNQKNVTKATYNTPSDTTTLERDITETDTVLGNHSRIIPPPPASNVGMEANNNPFSIQKQLSGVKNEKGTEKFENKKEIKEATKVKESISNNIAKNKDRFKVLPKGALIQKGTRKSEHKIGTSDFIFWIIILTLFIFAILINYKRSFILKSYKGILNENYLKLIKREEQNGFSPFFISLFVVFILSLGAFIYLVLNKRFYYEIGVMGYLYIILGILAVYFIRLLVSKLIGYVFSLELATEKFFFIILYYNILLGICLLVINVLFAFGSDGLSDLSYHIGLVIIGVLLFIRYIRGLLLSIQQSFLLKIHFIFYLCAVEIAPVLVFVKILGNLDQ